MHSCYQTKLYLHLSYLGNLELHPKIEIISTKHARSRGCHGNKDTLCNKANQAVEKSDRVNDAKIIITSEIDEGQQETMSQNDHGRVKQANNTQKNIKWQNTKFSVDMKSEQRNITDIRINMTHINGTIMEPVNVNYTRNIYFTVKTTHKYYTNRLLPLMLTWLQAVDKNKVR